MRASDDEVVIRLIAGGAEAITALRFNMGGPRRGRAVALHTQDKWPLGPITMSLSVLPASRLMVSSNRVHSVWRRQGSVE